MNSQQWNQQLQYQQSRLGEGGIPHPRSVTLSGRDDFMGGGMQQQQPSNQINAMGGGHGPMNPKNEYGTSMEKRQGSGRSYGGGSSQFNPFSHDGQGKYDNPYKKPQENNGISRTVVGVASDLSFLPGANKNQNNNQQYNNNNNNNNNNSNNTIDTARNNAPRSWKENQARARGSNIFSNSAATNNQQTTARQDPVWQENARGRKSTRNSHFKAMDYNNNSSSENVNNNNNNMMYGGGMQQQQQQQQYSMPPQQQQQTAVDYAYQQMQQFEGMNQAQQQQQQPPPSMVQQQQQAPPQRRRVASKVIITGSSRARSKGFTNSVSNVGSMNIPSHQRPTPSFNNNNNMNANNNYNSNANFNNNDGTMSSSGNGAKSRRDEVWEQKRQERMRRKQQGGGGNGTASNFQHQQRPGPIQPPSQQVQQGGYVPSFGIEGRRGNNGISNMSAQQYATSPKSGKGIW